MRQSLQKQNAPQGFSIFLMVAILFLFRVLGIALEDPISGLSLPLTTTVSGLLLITLKILTK